MLISINIVLTSVDASVSLAYPQCKTTGTSNHPDSSILFKYSIYHLLSFLSILLFSSPHLNQNMTVCLISCVPTQSQHQSQIWQHQVVWMFRARRCSILSIKSGSPARIRASRVLTQDIRIKRLDISIKMCESQKFLMQNNKEDR